MAMHGAYARKFEDMSQDLAVPLPRLACSGGFAGDPPSGPGPAKILPFPIQHIRRDGMEAGAHAQPGASAARRADEPAVDLGAPLAPAYWQDWMRAILDRRESLAVPA
jgi:hypothetical protein